MAIAEGSAGPFTIYATDGEGKPRFSLGGWPDGTFGLNMVDSTPRSRLALTADREGVPYLGLMDSAGSPVWESGKRPMLPPAGEIVPP